jgi:integrase
MASIHQQGETWYVKFRFAGRQFFKSLRTADESDALRTKARIEGTLIDIGRGRLVIPDGADVWAFIESDGRRTGDPKWENPPTLSELFKAYFDAQPFKEPNTIRTEGYHRDRLLALIGDKPVHLLTPADVQGFISKRAKDRKRQAVNATTIRKEVATLRMVLNRAERLIGRAAPAGLFKNLDYPKRAEKPPFQTWAEVERKVAGLNRKEAKPLWDSVFLSVAEVAELLTYVEGRCKKIPMMHPMLMLCAHTGARISEVRRLRVSDLDLNAGTVLFREKKKSKSSDTLRRGRLTPAVVAALRVWLASAHPGGPFVFCREPGVALTDHVVKNLFRRAVKNSKWSVLRGYHVMRHSFASNLAAAGTDQRVIDELMGHTTEEMRKRYRHLFPEQKDAAVLGVYG